MNSDYILIPIALLCLWTPGVIISSAEVREKLRQQVRRHDDGFASLLRNWVNWADLGRSAAGAWMLQRTITAFSVGQDDLTTVIMCVQIAILLIGVLAQTIWYNQKLMAIGPTFYLVGITLVVCGPKVAGFGLALGFTCALMLRRLSLGFYFIPASLVIFGILFHRFGLMTVFNAAAFSLPMLLAFAFGDRIAFARRPVKTRHMGYVYGGSYIPRQNSAFERDPIPAIEDVPDRNFSTTPPFGRSKPNGRFSPAPVLPLFPAQSESHPTVKPQANVRAVRQ